MSRLVESIISCATYSPSARILLNLILQSSLALFNALDPGNQHPSADLLARNLPIKVRIVEEDERETSGTRALLNFGHTIGHGIEAALPYGAMLHGEAISLGIRAALYLSEKINGFPVDQSKRILGLLAKFQLPLTLPEHISTDIVMNKLSHDKKFTGGVIKFVLLTAPGSAEVSDKVTLDDIREAVEHLRHSHLA